MWPPVNGEFLTQLVTMALAIALVAFGVLWVLIARTRSN